MSGGRECFAKTGVLFESFKKYFGANGPPEILVAFGSSRDANPSLPQAEIDRELERDPALNRAEYLSEWRSDVEGFIPREVVQACVGDYFELPPAANIKYECFFDAASGVVEGDSLGVVVGHKIGDRVITDAIREVRPPFDFFEAVDTVLLPICKSYRINRVVGDNYAGELAKEPIRRAGLSYEVWPRSKSEIYVDPFLPMLNARRIQLPRNDRAINQICSLERSVQRSGRDQISHPTHGHDDIANCIAGLAAVLQTDPLAFDSSWAWVDGPDKDAPPDPRTEKQKEDEANRAWHAMRYYNHVTRGRYW